MPTLTFISRCDVCDEQITYAGPSEFTGEPVWLHKQPKTSHHGTPELRVVVDATCPGCRFPEIGYAPAREEFVCSRCGHTTNDRPEA